MRNKGGLLYPVIILLVGFILFVAACKKESAKSTTAPWLSLNFAGSFSGNNVCSVSGTQAGSITVAATTPTQVSITNLYASGKTFYGTVSNDTCFIQPQIYNNGSGKAVMQGIIVHSSDSVMLEMIVTTFGQQDKCSAVLVKQ